MSKIFKTILSFLLFTNALTAGNDIQGFWKTINEEGVAQSIIAIYKYQGIGYGRIIATFDAFTGKIKESIYHPVERAPGLVGDPFYCGLDIIWDLEASAWAYKGKIMDPEHGRVYKAEIWTEMGDLIVRGKLAMFGRNQKWYQITPNDLTPDFKLPDPKSFVPIIHKTK
ncbi:MAG TPA: DUF2147 domain-containing protein [Chlamydiales bacterium]|nr:DUF2147 domain-containing protein [Chlamydiales bacterium]